ncbi:MAG: DUF2971 domain-containing protein [Pedosphaera sp.]|nr:DUF2971 domain-containing protein [Pedosphaera sp.]
MRLFKYVKPERVDILSNLEIAFTPPDALNDPFELTPAVKMDRAAVRREMKKYGPEFLARRPELDKLRRRKRKEAYQQWRDQTAKPQLRKPAESFQDFIPDNLGSRFGILCLSTTHDNLLMWSHYTDSHRGFVIEFDSTEPAFVELGPQFPINYSDERPVYDESKRNDIAAWQTKGLIWKYEGEYRVFRFLEDCRRVRKHTGDGDVFLVPFQPPCLRAVYLGCRTPTECEQQILEIAKKHSLRVLKGRPHRTSYALNFVPLN